MHSYCRCNQLGLVLLFATRCHFSIKLKPVLEEEASQGLPVVINYDWQVVLCTRPLTGDPLVSAILIVAADRTVTYPQLSHSTVSTTIYLSSISNIPFLPPPPPSFNAPRPCYIYVYMFHYHFIHKFVLQVPLSYRTHNQYLHKGSSRFYDIHY